MRGEEEKEKWRDGRTMGVNSCPRISSPRGTAHVYEVKLGRRRLVNARTPGWNAAYYIVSKKASRTRRCRGRNDRKYRSNGFYIDAQRRKRTSAIRGQADINRSWFTLWTGMGERCLVPSILKRHFALPLRFYFPFYYFVCLYGYDSVDF